MVKTLSKGDIESIVKEDPKFSNFLGAKIFIRESVKNKVYSMLAFKKSLLYLAVIELGDLSSNVSEAKDLDEKDWDFLSKKNINKNEILLSKKKVGVYPRPSSKGEIVSLEYYLVDKLGKYLFFNDFLSGSNQYI